MSVLFRWSKNSFILLILPRPWDNHAKIIEGMKPAGWALFFLPLIFPSLRSFLTLKLLEVSQFSKVPFYSMYLLKRQGEWQLNSTAAGPTSLPLPPPLPLPPEGTSYTSLYCEAPPGRGTFFGFKVYKKLRIPLVKEYKRVFGHLSFCSVDGPKNVNREHTL